MALEAVVRASEVARGATKPVGSQRQLIELQRQLVGRASESAGRTSGVAARVSWTTGRTQRELGAVLHR